MAKSKLNSALTAISGVIDNWVYRRVGDRTVICRRPRVTAAPSAAQLQVRRQFRLASEFAAIASADPILRLKYETIAQARHLPLRQVIITDFLVPPAVDSIDLSGYHGAIGDPIRVMVSDDAGVMSVRVALHAEDDRPLEQGAAVLQADVWVYFATTACTHGRPVRITATATDHPGHSGSKAAIWS